MHRDAGRGATFHLNESVLAEFYSNAAVLT